MILLVAFTSLLGLIVGSFLNVVIYRVPRHLSIVRPRSACPTCHETIRDVDNIPVISWLALRGRCHNCHSPISARYPLVEAGTAILFGLTAWRLGEHLDLGAFLVLDAVLVALAFIDVEHMLLPRTIVYTGLIGVGAFLLASAALDHQWHRLLIAVIWSAGWFTVFFAMNFVSPRALGFGDVRLSALLGLALAWLGVGVLLIGFFVSNLLGAVIGLTLIGLKKRRRDEPIPYGVYLAIGAVLAVFVGPALMTHWHYWPNAR